MKKYDFNRAHALILERKPFRAELGTAGDWDYTSETVWEKGEFKIDLLNPDAEIAGITGSRWDTPILRIFPTVYDGYSENYEEIPCFIGESTDTRPSWLPG